jgi:putative SOS response-associated peptidase YedK
MCGRIILTHKPKHLRGLEYDLQFEAWQGPRCNIAPTESVATILNDGTAQVQLTQWGLIPSWAKDAAIGNKMINARAETLSEKPAFKRPLQSQRCVILADGFYEWKAVSGSKVKQPMLVRLKSQEVFALAGLWDRWQLTLSSTIITTKPNDLMATVHNRMPVILHPDCVASWLSPDEVPVEELVSCLTPYPDSLMEMYPVSTLVNKPGVDRAECIQPVSDQFLL